MGYTHYWKTEKLSNKEIFDKFAKECKELHTALPKTTDSAGGYYKTDPLIIYGGMGEGKPTFNSEMINFNVDANIDMAHETFRIKRNESKDFCGNFCKTARKPYDLLVVACLIAASQIIGLTFSSDGFIDYKGVRNCDDLQSGIDFYNKVIQPIIPITQETLWNIRRKNRS